MKKIIATVLAALISCSASISAFATTPSSPASSNVVSPDWTNFNTGVPSDSLSTKTGKWLIGSLNYGMNKWYSLKFSSQQASGSNVDTYNYTKYLSLGTLGSLREHQVRPAASQAYGLAIALKTGLYADSYNTAEEMTFTDNPNDRLNYAYKSPELAKKMAIQLIKSVAKSHKSNTNKGWGDAWQSAHWAWYNGYAAWLLWDDLSTTDKSYVQNMMVHEANRLINNSANPPYWKNADGSTNFNGDSKAEENAWNADAMTLAYVMMPNHENAKLWQKTAVHYMISATAAPSDLTNSEILHGKPVSQWIDGYNIKEDGTIINHHIVHPLYFAIVNMHEAQAMYELANMDTPKAARHNIDKIYKALVDVNYNNKNIYMRNEDGTASFDLYYPDGSDWGEEIYDAFSNFDLSAHLFDNDNLVSISADKWAHAHIDRNIWQQDRYRDFTNFCKTYIGNSENTYSGREEAITARAAMAYLATWVANQSKSGIEYTNESFDSLVLDDSALFTEDFETQNTLWTANYGSLNLDSSESIHGEKSFKLSGGKNAITYSFDSVQSDRTVIIRFYDPNTSSGASVVANLEYNGSPNILGVRTSVSEDNYVYRIGGTWTETSIPRSKGWHTLKWDFSSLNGLTMSIDDIQVKHISNISRFTDIRLGDFWGYGNTDAFRFDAVEVFDKILIEDSFESSLDNFNVNQGNPTISSDQSLLGSNSLKISSGGQIVGKTFNKTHKNANITLSFYDNADDTSLTVAANAEANSNPYLIGVYTPKFANTYAFRVGSKWYDTGIARSTGWHTFKWVFNNGALEMFIDGTSIRQQNASYGFNSFRLGNFWSAPGNVYFDDLKILETK